MCCLIQCTVILVKKLKEEKVNAMLKYSKNGNKNICLFLTSTVMLSSCLLNRLPLFSCTWYGAFLLHDSNSLVVSKLSGADLQYF